MLLPEFASEVLGFLDRAHIGSSLLANRGLHDLICQLKQRLRCTTLRCAFLSDVLVHGRERAYGTYWLHIRHLHRDLSYTAVRRFKIPSASGAEDYCALIHNYLSNSHVGDLQATLDDFSFAIKMLASLAGRNFSVGRIELFAGAERLSDYRSMDAVFGGMSMSNLCLICDERRFVELVETVDFFRMSSIQRLQELKLTLTGDEKPRGHAGSKSPLWVCGVRQLRDCQYYRVNYHADRHLRTIERNMVHICEEFERGDIMNTVEHFQFSTSSAKGMYYAFNRDNLLVSGMKIEGTSGWNRIGNYEWDVYRFRSASTSEYLAACVAQYRGYTTKCILHLVRGEVYPDASFADLW
ncbi:hypothetical protein AAVH_22929 [Aphelenchoides avenae]|nr:hypothetical protein AAVH_22929 [Aphelenchus avenae]